MSSERIIGDVPVVLEAERAQELDRWTVESFRHVELVLHNEGISLIIAIGGSGQDVFILIIVVIAIVHAEPISMDLSIVQEAFDGTHNLVT